MSQFGATEAGNTVTITDAGPSRKKISIEIPAEAVSEKVQQSLDALTFEAQLPGFRKGRVPRGLIERRFGPQVREEARSQLVSSAYAQAIEEHKLRVIGEPVIESLPELDPERGEPLSFDVEVEVLPEFEIPEFEGIKVYKPRLEVTDDRVEEEIDRICLNEGELEERQETEPGDYLTGHGVMKGEDGTEFYDIPGAVVQAPPAEKGGRGMILGVMVEDFGEQMGRPKPGESFTVKTEGPEGHEVEELRGKKLTITFEVERIDRIVPAALSDLIARLGLPDEESFRSAIRQRMEQRLRVEASQAVRRQLSDHLLESVEVELPERMTAQQAARSLERRRMELMHRGVDPQQIEEHIAELRAQSHEKAARELKLFFILNKLAQDLNVNVDESELSGRIAQMASSINVRPDKLRQDLIQANRLPMVAHQVREEKVFDVLLQKSEVEEVSAEEYEKLMEGKGEG